MNRFDRTIYRDRLVNMSGRSLVEKRVLDESERKNIERRFDKLFPHDFPREAATFVHGDFSLGNLLVANEQICLIDFEHSHIGLAVIDLAHLYVNFMADEDADNANLLLDIYQSEANNRGLSFDPSLFQALTLERAAGKLNAMRQTDHERAEKLRELLEI